MSVIIKLITLPLTLKQQESMAKTRALQSQVQELQKKYGKFYHENEIFLDNFDFVYAGILFQQNCGNYFCNAD